MAILASSDQAVLDHAWYQTALDAAFPFDGARYPGGEIHDPSIVKFGDTYLMVGTSGNEFCPVSTSKDLLSWDRQGPILAASPSWLEKLNPGHRSIWAPFPLKVGNSLRMYYCASERFGHNTSWIGMVECSAFDPKQPTHGWVDKGMLLASKDGTSNFNAIDPDVCVGPDGRQWMVYGSYWSGIYEVELDPVTGLVKDPSKEPIHVASNTSERGNPLEAPALIFHAGYYYLFTTYGLAAQGIRSTYRTMVGRSRNPDGPFVGYTGTPMTEGGHTVMIKGSFPMFAPGGGNWFKGPGDKWWMAYHYYDGRRNWHGDMWGAPTLQVREVVWGDDEWPLPGLPVGVELRSGKIIGDWAFQIDFGRVDRLQLDSGGEVHLGTQKGHWELLGETLKLHWSRADDPGNEFVDSLVLDKSHQFFVGRNQFGSVIRGIKKDVQAGQ